LIFTPNILSSLWDTWLYYEDGVHYLFYLASTRLDRPWDSIGLAVSDDGVHFKDHGLVIYKATDAEFLGAGHTWKAGDKYIFNFSERRNGELEIFFAESDDLYNWTRIPDEESVSRLDPEWYAEGTEFSDQRWDNIWAIPDAGGEGFYGYVTAVAKDGPIGLRGTCASVTSKDGRVFTTGAPVIEPGVWGDKLEIGGVEKIGDSYFMFAAQAEVPLGLRWSAHHAQSAGGVYVLRSDKQEGPFELDPRQKPLLVSAPQHFTYFSRFYPMGDVMLSCHHTITPVRDIANIYPKPGTYLAPLKKVVVDDGILSFEWWEGNSALKGDRLPVSTRAGLGRGLASEATVTEQSLIFEANAGGQLAIAEHFDLDKGIVMEFDAVVSGHPQKRASAGLLIEHGGAWAGTAMVADTEGGFEIGSYNSYAFRAEDGKEFPVADSVQHWRVLIRQTLVEVYINDAFVQAYTLPVDGDGRVAFIAESASVEVSALSVWQMTL
jgi:hypothetical protein